MSSTSGAAAAARSYGVGYLANNAGVTMLTLRVGASAPTGSWPPAARTGCGGRARRSPPDTRRRAVSPPHACDPWGCEGVPTEGSRLHAASTAGTLADVRRLEIERQMDPHAIASVSALLTEAERADGHQPLSDHLWLDLVNGGGRARLRDGFIGGRSPATTATRRSPTRRRRAPTRRGRSSWSSPRRTVAICAPSAPMLIGAALDVIGAEGGGRVDWWVFEPSPDHDESGRRDRLAAGTPSEPDAASAADRGTTRHRDAGVRARRRRGRLAERQQPGLRGAPRAGRLGSSRRCCCESTSRGSIRPGSCSTSATVGSPASAGRSCTPITIRRSARST